MDVCWICANGTKPEHLTNMRYTPEINDYNIAAKLYTIGTKARCINETFLDVNGKTWSKYFLLADRKEVCIRNDVHTVFNLDARKILDVNHIFQSDNDDFFINECGIAAGSLVMEYGGFKRKSIDALATEVGMTKFTLTTFNHIIMMFKKYNFKPIFQRPFLLTDILKKIKEETPVVCLVDYSQLKGNKIPHFVVACGYDQEFVYCQDPLNSVKYINYSLESFSKAIANFGKTSNNMPYQSIYIEYTEEQRRSKELDLYKRVEMLEGQMLEVLAEIKKLRGD